MTEVLIRGVTRVEKGEGYVIKDLKPLKGARPQIKSPLDLDDSGTKKALDHMVNLTTLGEAPSGGFKAEHTVVKDKVRLKLID